MTVLVTVIMVANLEWEGNRVSGEVSGGFLPARCEARNMKGWRAVGTGVSAWA